MAAAAAALTPIAAAKPGIPPGPRGNGNAGGKPKNGFPPANDGVGVLPDELVVLKGWKILSDDEFKEARLLE